MIDRLLGHSGRLLSMSKGRYTRANPDHVVVFNARVHTSDGKIWHGDLDLTADIHKLQSAAEGFGRTLHVFHEYFKDPKETDCVLSVKADRSVVLSDKYSEHAYLKEGVPYLKNVRKTPTKADLIKESYAGMQGAAIKQHTIIGSYPTLKSYSTKGDMPYVQFYKHVADQLGETLEGINVSDIILNKKEGEALNSKQYDWCIKKCFDEYEAQKNFTMSHFNYGPVVVDATWALDGQFYVREPK